MRGALLFLMLAGSLNLLACGAATTETPAQAATPTPLPPPTATSRPANPTPVPEPTLTPTPLPISPTPRAEQPAAAYNPDLDYAQVLFVRARQGSDGRWTFETTVRHNDEGWDHYADAWQVIDPAGNILAERVLAHPHDTEQPFTRSQSNVAIPPELSTVIVRAKCNVHGFGGQEVALDLTTAQGEYFEVITR